jgi:ribosomal protein S18 acetylase RimI-like enzyme
MEPPFTEPAYTIGTLELRDVKPAEAEDLAGRITAIDPWRRLGYEPGALRTYFAQRETGARRRLFVEAGQAVGAAVIRHPWLRGPYIELLALFPEAQGQGHGGAFIAWLSAQAASRSRNLWVITSEANERALVFYQRHGFEPVGPLDDLVRAGECEILLRKRLGRPGSNRENRT